MAALTLATLCACSSKLSPEDERDIGAAVVEAAPAGRRLARAPAADGLGDPVNIAFAGSGEQLASAAAKAGWVGADPITLATTNRMVRAMLAKEPYPTAPVSALFWMGRRQDYAFQQASGGDPSTRHHVRFWLSSKTDPSGRPLWMGSATYDDGVAASNITKKMTHHISPEVDKERDKLAADLIQAGGFEAFWVDGFQAHSAGSNGDGFPFSTDRRLRALVARK